MGTWTSAAWEALDLVDAEAAGWRQAEGLRRGGAHALTAGSCKAPKLTPLPAPGVPLEGCPRLQAACCIMRSGIMACHRVARRTCCYWQTHMSRLEDRTCCVRHLAYPRAVEYRGDTGNYSC